MITSIAIATRACASVVALLVPWTAFAAQISPDYAPAHSAKDWTAEVTAAEAELAAARAAASARITQALARLGEAQLGQGNFVAAEATFREALTLTEQRGAPTSTDLIQPLSGLGRALVATDRFSAAIPMFERAVQIARRGYGLFSREQEPLLRGLATSLRSTGRLADANQYMAYTIRIAEQQYGQEEPGIVPAISTVVDWYLASGQVGEARTNVRLAVGIVEKKRSPDDIAVVVPLTQMARSYMLQVSDSVSRTGRHDSAGLLVDNDIDARRMVPEGERALVRALRILDATPDAPAELRIDTLIQAGDWFGIRQQPSRAHTYYRRAAALLSQLPATPGAGPLSFPVCIYYRAPLLALRNLEVPDEQIDEQYAEVTFDVRPDGSVDTARLKRHDVAPRAANDVLYAVRQARYRPRFENGEPVLTEALTFREVFRMRKVVSEAE